MKIVPGEKTALIFSGALSNKQGHVIISNCSDAQVCIDGHLTNKICGQDTISAGAGDHYISALDQLGAINNKSGWFNVDADSVYEISWNINYKRWEKTKQNI